jgi:hypothetical protein
MSYEKNDSIPNNAERKSGRAAFDDNGHTVWEWQTTTGVFERHVSDEKLHELTSPNLAIAEDFAPTRRKFEGLWVHDAHRPAAAFAPRKVEATPAVPPSSVLGLLFKLSRR